MHYFFGFALVFTVATLCYSVVFAVIACLSVCPSVRFSVLLDGV